jgi:DNA-binding NtrC family response regulator
LGKKTRILLVDDEDKLREVLSVVLETRGFDVQTAPSGTKGLCRCLVDQFDLLITDLNMPEMDGIQFAGIVHRINPRMGIIIITAHPLQWTPWNRRLDTYNLKEEVMKFDQIKHLYKPFSLADLLVLIDQFFPQDAEVESNSTK